MPTSAPPKDKSCDLDLPPLSQLDNSVLDALPDNIRDEILQGYVNKATKKAAPTKPAVTSKQTAPKMVQFKELPTVCEEHEQVVPGKEKSTFVISNEGKFLRDLRAYVKDWILNFIEGPPESDIDIFSDYLVELSAGNLDVVLQILKAVRRLVARLEPSVWSAVFNSLLDRVQEYVRSSHNGHLPIERL